MKSKKKIVNNLIKTPFPKSNPLKKDIFPSLVFGNKIIWTTSQQSPLFTVKDMVVVRGGLL